MVNQSSVSSASSGHDPDVVSDEMQERLLAILASLSKLHQVEFDPVEARRRLSLIVHDHPGTSVHAWSDRLSQLGKAIGLRVSIQQKPLGQALKTIRSHSPIVVVTDVDRQTPWLVVSEMDRQRVLVSGSPGRKSADWYSLRDFRRLLGVNNPNDVVTFAMVHAATPFESPGDLSESHHEPASFYGPLRRLFKLLRPEMPDIWVVLAYAVATGILLLATPIAVESLVSTVAFGGVVQPVVVLSLLLLCCLGFAATLQALQVYIVELIQRRLFVRLAADLGFRLPRVDYTNFEHHGGPEVVNRFFDILTVMKVIASMLLDALSLILSASIGLMVLAFYHPFLLGYDVLLLVVMVGTLLLLGWRAVPTAIAESRAKYDVIGRLDALGRFPSVFRHREGKNFAIDEIDRLARTFLSARSSHFHIVMRQIIASLAIQVLASTVLLGMGGWLVVLGQLSLGQLVAAELIVATVVGSFIKLGKHIEGYYDLLAAVEKIGHLVDLRMERTTGEGPTRKDEPASLHFEGATIHFPHALHSIPISFKISPGEKVALVGSSGSGKTLLGEILLGLRSIDSGRVQFDSVDLADVNLDILRSQMAVVLGEEIFAGTIADNVRVGRFDLTLSEVRLALENVGLIEELLSVQATLNTTLETGGKPLSQGQVARLLVARAIVGKPRLIYLDQTLDRLTEEDREKVIATLTDPGAPWTLLLATQDLAIAHRCQRIVHLPKPNHRSAELGDLSGGHSP